MNPNNLEDHFSPERTANTQGNGNS